jgi:flagellar biosynthesis/type III secretory pathway protein FliH
MIKIFGLIILTKKDLNLIQYHIENNYRFARDKELSVFNKEILTADPRYYYNLLAFFKELSQNINIAYKMYDDKLYENYKEGYDKGYKVGFKKAQNEIKLTVDGVDKYFYHTK